MSPVPQVGPQCEMQLGKYDRLTKHNPPWWTKEVLGARRTKSIVASCLRLRLAIYSIGSIRCDMTLTWECPQGSKLGLRLWNVTAEAALTSTDVIDYTTIVAYADDFVVLVAGNSRTAIQSHSEMLLTCGQRSGVSPLRS